MLGERVGRVGEREAVVPVASPAMLCLWGRWRVNGEEGQLAVAGLSGPRPWLAAGGCAESVGPGLGPARPEGVLRWSLPGRLGRLVLVQRASEAARRCEYHGVARRLLPHEVENDARGCVVAVCWRMSPQTIYEDVTRLPQEDRTDGLRLGAAELPNVEVMLSPLSARNWRVPARSRRQGRQPRGAGAERSDAP